MINTKKSSIVFLVLVYAVALVVAVAVFRLATVALFSGLFSMLFADIAATLVVWFFGIIFKNASVYDPYWSVVPPVIAIGWMYSAGYGMASILAFLAITIWSARLTGNFLLGWPGMRHQDWRYGMIKNKAPKLWLFSNLFGINLFPTLIVFACMLPVYYLSLATTLTAFSWVGFAICLVAVTLQIISDAQMFKFKQTKKQGEHIEVGLWKFSRHPNYLGEVLFWWGLWVMQMAVLPAYWLTVFAPIAMTLMFIFISIPMMETYMAEKCADYKNYQKRVSMLVFIKAKIVD